MKKSKETKTNLKLKDFQVKDKNGLISYFKFHDNNKVKHILLMKDGKNNGVEREYDSTGACIFECKWCNGKNMGWPSKL